MNNRAEGASFVSFLYLLEVVFVLIGTRRGANFGNFSVKPVEESYTNNGLHKLFPGEEKST